MRELPILFNSQMVQAILSGNKTQTRRVAKDVRHPDFGNLCAPGALVLENEPQHVIERACPLGQIGDRLYVKETWGVISYEMDSSGNLHDWTPDRPATQIHEMPFGRGYYSGHVIYRADGEFEFTDSDTGEQASQWKPSIHMPHIASRIQLEITGVRVERLQDCTDADALGEGVDRTNTSIPGFAKARYEKLWESIHGSGSWAANPWVWVIEFKVINKVA